MITMKIKNIIYIYILLLNFLFTQSPLKIATVSYINGSCYIENSLQNRSLVPLVGNSVFNNDVISSIEYHYPMYDENTNQILLFLKSAKNISCYRENEHLLNLEIMDDIGRTGFPLLLAIFCENMIAETTNES